MTKWWKKGYFDDLKPFDVYPIENFLDRYKGAISTFDGYYEMESEGKYFLGINSDNLNDPDVKYFNDKYNNPNCSIPQDPMMKICFVYSKGRNFNRPEYHTEENIKFKGRTSNYNGRDGQIRTGWSSPKIEHIHINPVRNGKLTGNWVYLELPHELFYRNTIKTGNGASIELAKKFVKEVESTIGWDDIEKIKNVIEKYDKIDPDWSHDFPINGYFQLKKDGLLFPGVWDKYNIICGHSYHRMIMTSFNKVNFPFILPVPKGFNGKWYACSKYNTFTFNNEDYYLGVEVDINNKNIEYTFTKNKNWAKQKNANRLKTI